jgi:hypothetical protein
LAAVIDQYPRDISLGNVCYDDHGIK